MGDVYTVILVNKWGHILERDGTLSRADSTHTHFEQQFADMVSARHFCDSVVRELPHVECNVLCEDQLLLQHFDAEWRRNDEERIRRMYAEQRRHDWLMISTGIGAMIVIVAVLVLWLR